MFSRICNFISRTPLTRPLAVSPEISGNFQVRWFHPTHKKYRKRRNGRRDGVRWFRFLP